jgi:NADH-quinone oxidoreductase subunit J
MAKSTIQRRLSSDFVSSNRLHQTGFLPGSRKSDSTRMIGTALFFYLFAGVCVASALMVVASRNPVHSVLFLILAFVNAAGLFVLMGAEFLAMIVVVVYVGAVAVLFLFVVMMLDVDFTELRQGALNYLPFGTLIGIIFLVELLLVLGTWVIGPAATEAIVSPIPPIANVPNTQALGLVLYTRFIYFFQAAGLVLLVAMIGAIVLTLRHKPNVKRQVIAEQVARTKATSIEIRQVKPGQGI